MVAFTVAGAAVLFGFRIFIFQPFYVPTTSMHPSLVAGDYFFISKFAYRTVGPERGDIAIFRDPSGSSVEYAMRVIGLPGDRVRVMGGVLYLNGEAVKRERVELAPEFSREGPVIFYRETLPEGRSYVIAEVSDDLPADNTEEYIVPAGHYFALGDNRDNSQDSRFLDAVGYIPRGNFIGPFVARFWNSQGFSLSNRPEELP